MRENFNFKKEYNGVKVQYTDSLSVFEREIHSYHELLFCEEEKLTLHTENRCIGLDKGDLVIIPKGVYHFFDLSKRERFKRVKISFEDEFIKERGLSLFYLGTTAVSFAEGRIRTLLERLCEVIACEGKESDFFVRSAAIMLLAELEISGIKAPLLHRKNNEIIIRTVRRISENLSSDLSVFTLAKSENVSPSFLTHNFKKEVGISLHKYVLARRMAYAKELMENGEKPTKIYISCGFGDYSSFYKAYVAYYGATPSEKK